MKENIVFRVSLLLSSLVLTIGGQELKSINSGENTGQILTSQQVNKTIQAEDGDIYDCVDVNLQPTFKHPLLKGHKIQAAGIKYWDEIYGIRASINVYDPYVKKDSKDLSASWIQIENGPKVCDGGAVIGAGSFVSPSFNGDSYARFHIGWIDEKLNKSCNDHDCPGFVQFSCSVGLGGKIHPVSGPQYDPKTKNWWLAYGSNNTLIGYWPASQISFIKDKGDFAFWGGHVQVPMAASDRPQMGSGHFASEGFGKAAFMEYSNY